MKKILRHLWLLLFGVMATLSSHQARASHAIGSDMYYVNAAPGLYVVFYRFYLDCSGVVPPRQTFDLAYAATGCGANGTGTNPGGTITLTRRGYEPGNPYCGRINNQAPCDTTGSGSVTPFPNYGVFSFSGLLALGTDPAAQCSSWRLSTEENARPETYNITGGTLYSFLILNNRDLQDDSSPSFSAAQGFKPLIFTCDSATSRIGNAVVDPDGDSLVYSLAPAYIAAPLPGNGGQATYRNGLTATSPIRIAGPIGGQPSLPFTVNRNTGEISFTAGDYFPGSANDQDNKFTVVVQVDAYRRINGTVVKTATVRRDILVVIYNCNGLPAAPIVPGGDSAIVNSGVDTLYYAAPNDTLTVDACNSTKIDIPIFDRNRDSVYVDIDQRQLPGGASIRLTRSSFSGSFSQFTAQLTWTPDSATIGGYYIATLNIRDNGCPLPARTTQSLILHVIKNEFADVGLATQAATSDTLCVGQRTTLVATTQRPATIGFPPMPASYTYHWLMDADSTVIRSNNDSAIVAPIRTTRYKVEVVSPVGCVDTASVVVIVDTTNHARAEAQVDTVCRSGIVTLNAIPRVRTVGPDGRPIVYTYKWAPDPSLANDSIQSPVVRPLVTTRYRVTVYSSLGCTDTASIVVNVDPTNVARAEAVNTQPNNTVCPEIATTLKATPRSETTAPDGTPIIYTYRWTPDPTLSDTTSQSPTVTLPQNGGNSHRYFVTIFSSAGCTDTASVVLRTDALPTYPVGQETTLPTVTLGNDPVQLDVRAQNDATGFTYSFAPATGLDNTNTPTPTVSNLLESTTYTVTATNAIGCSVERMITVDVALFIPNVITPGNDSKNDRFDLRGISNDTELLVFNRWGKKVADFAKYNNTWNGGDLPAGTYYYLITDKVRNKSYKGWVEIIR